MVSRLGIELVKLSLAKLVLSYPLAFWNRFWNASYYIPNMAESELCEKVLSKRIRLCPNQYKFVLQISSLELV